jgi:hypothetical protein
MQGQLSKYFFFEKDQNKNMYRDLFFFIIISKPSTIYRTASTHVNASQSIYLYLSGTLLFNETNVINNIYRASHIYLSVDM